MTPIETYLCLRIVVGYLGEKDQHGWWPSSFFSASSSAFLQPVFPRSHLAAAYHGVVEAGRRLHDQHIGIGRVFHLFRLPEEQELLSADETSPTFISSIDKNLRESGLKAGFARFSESLTQSSEDLSELHAAVTETCAIG